MRIFKDLQPSQQRRSHPINDQRMRLLIGAAGLSLLSVLFLCGCDGNGGGGGGGGDDAAILTVRILPDCAGLTGCTDIYIDGVKVGNAIAADAQISEEVSVGVHTIYASGECEVTRIWGPYDVDVPAEGKTETLSCAPEASVPMTLEADPNCAGVERDIAVKLDEVTVATLQPGGERALHVSPGLHVLSARSMGGFLWGPVTRNISAEGHTETFACNPAAQAPLTVSVSADCPQLDHVQISVDGDYMGQVNCGANGVTADFSNGYRTITAVGFKIYQVETFSAGPYEVYLPASGASFIIPGGDFRLSPRSRQRSR
jgi:hypothetical protein